MKLGEALAVRFVLQDEALTLADAVVQRERLAREAGVLREVAKRAMPQASRWLRTEVKHVRSMSPPCSPKRTG